MTAASVSYNDLGPYAQKVWQAGSLPAKKAALAELIGAMKFKSKRDEFLRQAQQINNGSRLDRMASDIMLVDTDRRIK